jgi:hypothetical protein
MIDQALARMQEPRFGVVLVSGALSVFMSVHWWPMAVPSVLFLGLCLTRFDLAARPAASAILAACWFAAMVVVPERIEDHVPLFSVWLVALAVSLAHRGTDFVDHASWHARMLVGVAFTAAVAWKLYFGTYLNGVTLWLFVAADSRFGPLAAVLGLSQDDLDGTRAGLSDLLDGTTESVVLEASPTVVSLITATAVLTLALEAVIAVSHLVPDSTRLASLRLPSVVLFGVVTYAVVPVVPFAGLLAMLAMTTAKWRRSALWVLPVLLLVSTTRLATLTIGV